MGQWLQLAGGAPRWLPGSIPAVNRGHPLARGLRGVFGRWGGGQPLMNGALPSADTSSVAKGVFGYGAAYSGSANTQFPAAATLGGISGAFSLFCILDINALSNYGAIIAHQDSTTTNGFEVRCGNAPTEGNLLIHRASAAQYSQYRCSSAALAVGRGIRIGFASDGDLGTAPVVIVNGDQQAQTLVQAGSGTMTASTSSIWIGRRSDGATQLDGALGLLLLYDRFLSIRELLNLNGGEWADLIGSNIAAEWVPSGGATARTAITSLTAAVQAARTATASLSAAVRAPQLATAAINAAVAQPRTAASAIDAAVRAAVSAAATVDTAVQAARSATANVDAAVRAPRTAGASLDSVVAVARSATAAVDAAVRAAATAGASLNAAVRDARSATASLNAYVLGGTLLTATLDAAVQAALAATANLSAAIQQPRSAAAALDALVIAGGQLTAQLDAAVQQARSAQVSLSAAIALSRTAAATIDARVVNRGLATADLGAAVLAVHAGIVRLSAYVLDLAAPVYATAPAARIVRTTTHARRGQTSDTVRPAQTSRRRRTN